MIYMMLEVRDQLNVDKGIKLGLEQGLEQGLAQGIEQGEGKLAQLVQALAAAGRIDELSGAVANRAALQALYEEYGIE